MATRTVETEQARTMLLKYLEGHPLPMVVEINSGKVRSKDQNKLLHRWLTEISEQMGDSHEYWRGYCKLHFGVPIRRRTSAIFRAAYDRDIKYLPYEMKLKLFTVPFDMPVTRDFKVKEMTEYLNEVHKFFSGKGVVLTDPEAMRLAAMDRDMKERTGR